LSDGHFDNEIAQVFFVRTIRLFANVGHMGKSRSLFKRAKQLLQMIVSADSEDLNPAIAPITDIAIHAQFPGDVLDVVAKADSLHPSRNNVPPRENIPFHSAIILTNGVQLFPNHRETMERA
jgi:hypothetical protein